MLRKLLKYEFKATARTMVPLYIVLIAFSLFHLVINPLDVLESTGNTSIQTIIAMLDIMLYVVLIVGLSIMTLVIMIQRFYKNLLGDEGYLMFTLPVKPWLHIISKLLISMLWAITSFLVTMGSVLIISQVPNLAKELGQVIEIFKQFLGVAGFFTVPLYGLIAIASSTVMIYAAMALGHLFSRRRVLASFGMYIILYIVYQVVLSVCMLSVTIFYGSDWANIDQMAIIPAATQINLVIIFITLASFVLTATSFTATNLILKKRLNLE